MLTRFESAIRRIRRRLSRSAWLARALGLENVQAQDEGNGLIMIQIDGLSQPELCKALEKGEMPFLQQLLEAEHYQLHSLYPGLPTSTPSVQGELFYGPKMIVPAFSFVQHKNKKVYRMFDPGAASEREQHLAQLGDNLLQGGSAYCDIYTGGAQEAHFCPSALGWGDAMRAANPLVILFFIVSHFYSFLRTSVLLFIELFIAIGDCIRGLIDGRDLWKEILFIPARVATCILLRELITIGVKMDIARGLPVIHLNLIGFDEQAHRRGPTSKFAHWSLKGIDDAIARIWRAAKRAEERHYEVWIYSDHGQEDTRPYSKVHGRSIQQAVESVFDKLCLGKAARTCPMPAPELESMRTWRAELLGGRRIQRILLGTSGAGDQGYSDPEAVTPVTTAMGPVGHIYFPQALSINDYERVARALVSEAHVPLVMYCDPGSQERLVRAITAEGDYHLPNDGDNVFGKTHPFLAGVISDAIDLCRHEDAGQFVIYGWCDGSESYSFGVENGSHAGCGPNETHAFALMPDDTKLAARSKNYLGISEIRGAALHLLGRQAVSVEAPAAKVAPDNVEATAGSLPLNLQAVKPSHRPENSLRILTYNVHSCIGMDGQLSPERVARVIAKHRPDIVALQEIDVLRQRSGSVDQAQRLAQLLQMDWHFFPTIHSEHERFGDAVLSHLPMRLVQAKGLPHKHDSRLLEPRGAIWVEVEFGGQTLQLINTHLDVLPVQRSHQLDALLGESWLGHLDCSGPVIVCGDFNATPRSSEYRRMSKRLRDAQAQPGRGRKSTFPSRFPAARIDYVFVSQEFDVIDCAPLKHHLARNASDHLPVLCDIRFSNEFVAALGSEKPGGDTSPQESIVA